MPPVVFADAVFGSWYGAFASILASTLLRPAGFAYTFGLIISSIFLSICCIETTRWEQDNSLYLSMPIYASLLLVLYESQALLRGEILVAAILAGALVVYTCVYRKRIQKGTT